MIGRLLASHAEQPPRAQPPPRARPGSSAQPGSSAEPLISTEDAELPPSTQDIDSISAKIEANLDLLRTKYFEDQNALGFNPDHYAYVLNHFNTIFDHPFRMAFTRRLLGSELYKYLLQHNADIEKALAKLTETHSDYKR
jgi:hypothetical protein